MNARLLLLLAIFTIILLPSCSKNEVRTGTDEVWVVDHYDYDKTIYNKASQLDENNAGIILHGDGTLTDRKNSSWCGTPPLLFTNYRGTWEQDDNGIYTIHTEYWGGSETYRMQIIHVNGGQVITKRL